MDKLVFSFLTLLCSILSNPNVVHGHVMSNVLPASQETALLVRDTAFKITLDHAQQVDQLISSMIFSSIDDRAKMAWEDCLELYEDTVYELSQTSLPSSSVTTNVDDIQTYLSAANTNHETCKNGFLDLNLSSHLNSPPFTLTINFSKSLANALAINAAVSNSIRTTPTSVLNDNNGGGRRLLAKEFPSWMSTADRKLLQLSGSDSTRADLVVAKDGTGNFKTISEAVTASKKLRSGTSRFIIYVKAGVYNENVVVTNKMKNLMLIGEGIDATIVTSNKNVQDGSTTFRSATCGVSGEGFIAKGITFENTAGPEKHQAVALRSGSDFSIFYGCSFKGYQDTLYVYSKRQFYKNCDIYGTVDFIFGNAVAILQNCNIYVRRPMSNQMNTVTAQSRSDPNENTGIVIHDSIIEAGSDLRPVQGSFRTYLGRPWKMYSRVVVMKSNIDRVVDPAGWAPWNGDFALKSLYYAEYMNVGAGAGTGGRVNWPGYRLIASQAEAGKFTVGNFLAGDAWIPNSGVPFTSGL